MTKKKRDKVEHAVIPFHRPHIDKEDRNAVKRVLDSGWLTTGKEASLFEHEFGEFVRNPACLAVSSCTAALHLALVLAGVESSDCVIVPTLTFTATAAAAVMCGAKVILADIDADTLTLGAKNLADVGNLRNVVAVMPVHFAGNPSRFGEVLAWGQLHSIKVIDDAAHAFPAAWNGWPIGSPVHGGFASCFSFYPTKPITTAEGGMLVMTDPTHLERARRLSLHGVDADAYQRSRQAVYHYEVTEHGWKYNLPDLLAALGRSQLHKAKELAQRRYYIAEQYIHDLWQLQRAGLIRLPVVLDSYNSAWHLFVVQFELERLKADWTRDRISEELRIRGVGTSVHYRPLHRHPFWKEHCFGTTDQLVVNTFFPNAERAYSQMLSLPIWPGMEEKDVSYIVEQIQIILEMAII